MHFKEQLLNTIQRIHSLSSFIFSCSWAMTFQRIFVVEGTHKGECFWAKDVGLFHAMKKQPISQSWYQHSWAHPCIKESWALDGFLVQHFAPQTTTLYFVWRSHSTYNVKPIYTSKKCGRSLYLYGNYGKEMHCEFATFTLRNCLFLYSYSDKAGIIVVTITLIMWIFLPVFSHNLQRNISQPAICGTDARQHVSSTMQGNM